MLLIITVRPWQTAWLHAWACTVMALQSAFKFLVIQQDITNIDARKTFIFNVKPQNYIDVFFWWFQKAIC